jgi:hypothetical protein
MNVLKDRRVILAGGAGLALAAGLAIAALMISRKHESHQAPPASQGGLMVQASHDDDIKLDARRPLRCFVSGQFVGEMPVSACAHRNGVATGALDVGLDPNGALAASNGASADITPLPPQPVTVLSPPVAVLAPAPAAGVVQAGCWRYAAGAWQRMTPDMPLSACVQSLYAGQCQRPGGAAYGRWSDRTLRLAPGRVEVSNDNRNFRTLVEQGPGCSVPGIG